MSPVDQGSQDDADRHEDKEPVDPTGEDDVLDISDKAADQRSLGLLGLSSPYGGCLRSLSFLDHN